MVKLLCIGGPWDGKWIELPDDQRYILVPIYPDQGMSGVPISTVSISTVEYTRVPFRAGEYQVEFLVLDAHLNLGEFALRALQRWYRPEKEMTFG